MNPINNFVELEIPELAEPEVDTIEGYIYYKNLILTNQLLITYSLINL